MKVYTSQYRYSGPDRLDITAKGNDPIGRYFAPSWSIVMGYKDGHITSSQYTTYYTEQMRHSMDANPEIWTSLFHVDRVVLVCFCRATDFCHRFLLASILEHAGAEYCGEIDA